MRVRSHSVNFKCLGRQQSWPILILFRQSPQRTQKKNGKPHPGQLVPTPSAEPGISRIEIRSVDTWSTSLHIYQHVFPVSMTKSGTVSENKMLKCAFEPNGD
jgi:hypothetical protein